MRLDWLNNVNAVSFLTTSHKINYFCNIYVYVAANKTLLL